MSESQKRERFGRYLILDHLVDGGMAKICRARFLDEQVDKLVAIKMVQAQFSKEESFKTMFMDEIKVTFGLHHPNVIQTYEYGLNKGQLFVAMEYCDGRNLKEYLEKLKERKFIFPVEICTYIISQACQGLFYAHTFRDKLSGIDANIIHRDISPHNIMLTYDGTVKIIDFGIAKSKTSSETTQAGTIKGKLSYLAPEYLEGLELDARYDQFALGITLWEMLCSRKLFKENNDLAVLKKIQECKIPAPSSLNPNVPAELDAIVLKALSKDRDHRFENLDQMNRALMKFLYANYPNFNSSDLLFFSKELFREEIEKDHVKIFEFGKIDIRPYLNDIKKEIESGTREGSIENRANEIIPKIKEQMIDMELSESNTLTKENISIKNGGLKTDIKISESKNESGKGATFTQKSKLLNNGTRTIKLQEKKAEVHQKRSFGTVAALFTILAGCVAYYFSQHYGENNILAITHPTTAVVTKERHPAQLSSPSDVDADSNANKGTILLTHFDKQKMQVFLDGHKMEVDALGTLKVPVAREFFLRVQIEGKKHFVKELRVENTSSVEIEIPEMTVNAAYGYVNTSSHCADGEIRFDLFAEKRVSPIPMIDTFGISFPLETDSKGKYISTNYQLFFKKTGEDIERKIDITITREDQTVDLCELL